MKTSSSVRVRFWTSADKEERATRGSLPLPWLIIDTGTRPPAAMSSAAMPTKRPPVLPLSG
eukprot:14578958-Alexandrium_andersonii.AAC.1